jgi:hypothetical protein
MPLKIAPASPEEHAFAAEVNKRISDNGGAARVHAFTLIDTETEAKTYHLAFQYGSKRTTIAADSPFHLDPVEDIIKRVQDWIAGLSAANRWSTDLKYAD